MPAKPFAPYFVAGTPSQVITAVGNYLAAGPRHLTVRFASGDPLGQLELWSRDMQRCEVKVEDEGVSVTATELRLLTTLAKNPGRVYRREELARLALGDDFDGLDRTIDAHIKNLRRKLGCDGIATVFGIGYKFVA